MLFIAGDNTKSLLVNLSDKTIARNYAIGPTQRYSTAYCPVNHTIVAHQARSCAFFLSPSTQQPLQRSFSPQTVASCAVSSCGSFMIGGGESGTLLVWSTRSGQLYKNFKAHLRSILSISVSRDNSFVVTASEDSVCKVWSLASLVSMSTTEVQPFSIFTGHTLGVNCCTFLNQSNMIITASTDKTCRLFDPIKGEQVHAFTIGDVVTAVAVKADDSSFVAGTKTGFLYFRDIYAPTSGLPHAATVSSEREKGAILREPHVDTHHSAIVHLSYSDMNTTSVLTVSENGSVLWYDSDNGKLLGEAFPKMKLRIFSCCRVPAQPQHRASLLQPMDRKSTCAGLNKNPIDPTVGDYIVSREELKASKKAAAAASRKRPLPPSSSSPPAAEGAGKEQPAVEPQETAETIEAVLARNAELENLKAQMEAKLKQLRRQ